MALNWETAKIKLRQYVSLLRELLQNQRQMLGWNASKTGTYKFAEEIFLTAEKDTEENLDKNEILKIISDYIEGTERFTDKSSSN